MARQRIFDFVLQMITSEFLETSPDTLHTPQRKTENDTIIDSPSVH